MRKTIGKIILFIGDASYGVYCFCPHCGCDDLRKIPKTKTTHNATCVECEEKFIIELEDEPEKASPGSL